MLVLAAIVLWLEGDCVRRSPLAVLTQHEDVVPSYCGTSSMSSMSSTSGRGTRHGGPARVGCGAPAADPLSRGQRGGARPAEEPPRHPRRAAGWDVPGGVARAGRL